MQFVKICVSVVIACLALCFGLPARASTWVKAESKHFIVYSDAGAKIAQAYLMRLEQYRYVLSGYYGIAKEDDDATPLLPVYFVADLREMQQISPGVSQGVVGFFRACDQGQAAVGIYENDSIRQTRDARSQAENTSQAILFHEYAHNFMFQHGNGVYPPWYVEGFAEYFSTTKIQNDQAEIGVAFSVRADTLASGRVALKYEDMLRDDWRKKGHDNVLAENAFYAQSWLLTHFILSDPARRQQMNAFLIDYRQGADPVEAFEKAFGIKVKDLASLLDRYMRSFPAAIYQFKDMPSPDITVTTLPASANKLLLWDAADRLCPLQGEMAPLLEKIRTEAALYPGDDFAARVLAQAEIILGDEWKAVDYLQGRIAAVPDDAQAHFMLGQAWYLMTVHKHLLDGETADSQMDKARRELGRAYTLDPLDAPTLYYYARSLARAGQPPSDNMIAAAMEAQALEPNVSNYSAYAAFLLIQRDRFDEAKEMLTSLASNPHAPREAAWAKSVIAAIDRHASPQEISKAFSSPTPADTPAEAPAK